MPPKGSGRGGRGRGGGSLSRTFPPKHVDYATVTKLKLETNGIEDADEFEPDALQDIVDVKELESGAADEDFEMNDEDPVENVENEQAQISPDAGQLLQLGDTFRNLQLPNTLPNLTVENFSVPSNIKVLKELIGPTTKFKTVLLPKLRFDNNRVYIDLDQGQRDPNTGLNSFEVILFGASAAKRPPEQGWGFTDSPIVFHEFTSRQPALNLLNDVTKLAFVHCCRKNPFNNNDIIDKLRAKCNDLQNQNADPVIRLTKFFQLFNVPEAPLIAQDVTLLRSVFLSDHSVTTNGNMIAHDNSGQTSWYFLFKYFRDLFDADSLRRFTLSIGNKDKEYKLASFTNMSSKSVKFMFFFRALEVSLGDYKSRPLLKVSNGNLEVKSQPIKNWVIEHTIPLIKAFNDCREYFFLRLKTEESFIGNFDWALANQLGLKVSDKLIGQTKISDELREEGAVSVLVAERVGTLKYLPIFNGVFEYEFRNHSDTILPLLRKFSDEWEIGLSDNRKRLSKLAEANVFNTFQQSVTYVNEVYYNQWMKNLRGLYYMTDLKVVYDSTNIPIDLDAILKWNGKVQSADGRFTCQSAILVNSFINVTFAEGEITISGWEWMDHSAELLDILNAKWNAQKLLWVIPTSIYFIRILNTPDVTLKLDGDDDYKLIQVLMSLFLQSQLGLRQDEIFSHTILLPSRPSATTRNGISFLPSSRKVTVFNTGKNSNTAAMEERLRNFRNKVQILTLNGFLRPYRDRYAETVEMLHVEMHDIQAEFPNQKITVITEKPIILPDLQSSEILEIFYRYINLRPKDKDVNLDANLILASPPNWDGDKAQNVIGGLRWTPSVNADPLLDARFLRGYNLTTHNLRALYATYSYVLYAPKTTQELYWIGEQLGHSAVKDLATASRYNSRRVETGTDLPYAEDQANRFLVDVKIYEVLSQLVQFAKRGDFSRVKKIDLEDGETVQLKNLKRKIVQLENQLENQVEENGDDTILLYGTETKVRDTLLPVYFIARKVVNPEYFVGDSDKPLYNLFERMSDAGAEISPRNFELLGYSQRQAFRIRNEAVDFLT